MYNSTKFKGQNQNHFRSRNSNIARILILIPVIVFIIFIIHSASLINTAHSVDAKSKSVDTHNELIRSINLLTKSIENKEDTTSINEIRLEVESQNKIFKDVYEGEQYAFDKSKAESLHDKVAELTDLVGDLTTESPPEDFNQTYESFIKEIVVLTQELIES